MSKRVTGVAEWADHSINICLGCSHDCHYCYAKEMATRYHRCTAAEWSKEVINQKAVNRQYGKRKGRIMFPTSHDITPGNVDDCITVILRLLEKGNEVLVVSKPHYECIDLLLSSVAGDLLGQLIFRFTIGSWRDSVLKFWEPGAPLWDERLECLKLAKRFYGCRTSVSMEPLLSPTPHAVIDKVSPYVTEDIWLGKPNKLMLRLGANGAPEKVCQAGAELLEQLDERWARDLYQTFKDNPLIRWKDSLQQVLGITETGAQQR